MVFGVLIVMVQCLIMLAYALSEQQWIDPIINYQHFIDEVTIYILCVLLLLFSSYVSADMRYLLGFFLIGICFAYVVFNTIIILTYSLHLFWVFLRRIYVQCHRKKLRNEVIKTVKKLNSDRRYSKIWFTPDKIEDEKDWF